MTKALADLACEYWKLLKGFERAASLAPDEAKPRMTAQARYAGTRLDAILQGQGVRLVTFDGLRFEVNLPATAINAEDIAEGEEAVIERTLEPAIVSDDGILAMGKVIIKVSR